MGEGSRFSEEIIELGKIDYLLDHLARAVERGEVHHSAYDVLAPRYLERRAELVEIITGVSRARELEQEPFAAAVPVVEPVASRHVAWTTVLLYLGAFLVVVASAIFSVAVWDLLSASGKLAFLGTVTALFYGAGWWAHSKLESRVGGTTLTVVASALLLFDGWIAIDGYGLEGPLPWAVLLLVCSAVYWVTEVRLTSRYFGVVGAAAQLGWWWLLGEGIGLPAPTRLAAMALVALTWDLTAQRAKDAPAFRSLASVLRAAAPATQALLAVGLIAYFERAGSVGPVEVIAAGIVALTGAWTLARATFASDSDRHMLAAGLQLPFFASVAVAMSTTGHSWLLAGALLSAAIAYAAFALFAAGAPFAVVALGAELLLVLEVGLILGLETEVLAGCTAVLAATWAGASRLAESLSEVDGAHVGAAGVARVAEFGALWVLTGSSLVLGLHLAGAPVARWGLLDLATSLAVFVSWSAAFFVRRRAIFLIPTVVASWLPVAVIGVVWMGGAQPAVRFGLLAAAAAVWLAVSGAFAASVGRDGVNALRWIARNGVLAAAVAGCALEVWFLNAGTALAVWGSWPAAALALGGAVVLVVESQRFGSAYSAAAAGGLVVLAGAMAGGGTAPHGPEQFALAGTAVAAFAGGAGVLARRLSGRFGAHFAVTAASAGTGAALAAASDAPAFAAALGLSTAAWVLAAVASSGTVAYIAGFWGLVTIAASLRWLQVFPWVTVIAIGTASLLLVAASLRRSADETVRFPVAGTGLGVAGLTGCAGLVVLGWFAEWFGGTGRWWDVGGHLLAVSMMLLGTAILVLAWRYRVHRGLYTGWAAVLLALWVEFHALSLESAEWFSTSLAVYLLAMGYLARRLHPDRPHPVVMDAAAVAIGLGVPLWLSLVAYPPDESFIRPTWAIGLSLAAITSGVFAKVRWYFFGGVGSLAAIAFYRSFSALAEFWWLALFVIGVALLAVALTWERQRIVVGDARDRFKRSFEQWR